MEHRLEFRPLLWAGIGIGLGMIINPYFPDNLIFTWHHLLPKLQEATSVSVGNEWYPYDTLQLLREFPAGFGCVCKRRIGFGIDRPKNGLADSHYPF